MALSNTEYGRTRHCLIVLGMHRSGTSALTRSLSLAGADLPATLMGGAKENADSNAKGHWESKLLVRFNDRVLASAGISWESPELLSEAWSRSGRFDQYRNEAKALLSSEFGDSELFVFKDPRLCKLLPFWIEVLRELRISPFVVTMVRSPSEVAKSLLARNGLDPSLGEIMWLRYVLEAERSSREIPRCHASYDSLLEDWTSVIGAVQSATSIEWPALSAARRRQISAFISQSDRHHVASPRTMGDGTVSGWCDEIYATMRKWAGRGEEAADHLRVDQIADALDNALLPLLPQILAAYEKTNSAHKLQRIRTQQSETIQALQSQISEQQSALKTLEEAKRGLEEIADAQRLQAVAGKSAGEKLEAGIKLLNTAVLDLMAAEGISPPDDQQLQGVEILDVAKFRLAVLVDALRSRESRVRSEAKDAQAAQTQALEIVRSEVISLESANATLQRDLAAQMSEVERLNGELERGVSDLRSAQGAASEFRKRCEEISTERDNLSGRIASLTEQLTAAQQVVSQTRKEIGKGEREITALRTRIAEVQTLAEQRKKSLLHARAKAAEIASARDLANLSRDETKQRLTAKLEENQQRASDLKRDLSRMRSRLSRQRDDDAKRIASLEQCIRDLDKPVAGKSLSDRKSRFQLAALVGGAGKKQANQSDSDIALLRGSHLFDPVYYLVNNPDVRQAGIDPARHYLQFGALEGRLPSEDFDSRRYLADYADVAASGVNPLVHYLSHGVGENRKYRAVEVEGKAKTSPPKALIGGPDTGAEAHSDETEFTVRSPSTNVGVPIALKPAEKAEATVQFPAELVQEEHSVGVFGGLAKLAKDWVRSTSLPEESAVVVGKVRLGLRQKDDDDRLPRAIGFFAEELIVGIGKSSPSTADRIAQNSLIDGKVELESAWLDTELQLRVMVANRSDRDFVLRVCQRGDDRTVRLCSEQLVINGKLTLCHVELADRFRPVLLVLCAADGTLLDASVFPFPSLLPGGLHSAELIADQTVGADIKGYVAYCAGLLERMSDHPSSPGISTVLVNLTNALGSEAIFANDMRCWLWEQFGVLVQPEDGQAIKTPSVSALEGSLRRFNPSGREGELNGLAIRLNHDAVPSLALLTINASDLSKIGTVRTIVVGSHRNRPEKEIAQPLFAPGGQSSVAKTFEPPLSSSGAQRADLIVSVRYPAHNVAPTSTLYPVAPDAPCGMRNSTEPLSVIIRSSGKLPALQQLLRTLLQQHGVAEIDCAIVGEVDKEWSFEGVKLGQSAVTLRLDQCSDAEWETALDAAVAVAKYDSVLLLDDCKILHDKRTVEWMRSKLEEPHIGTVGCALVSGESLTKKGFAGLTRRGWIASYSPLGDGHFSQPDFMPEDLPGDVAVLANPLSALMTRKDAWEMAKKHREEAGWNDDLSVGTGFLAAGWANISLSKVSILDVADHQDQLTQELAAKPERALSATSTIEY